MAASALDSAVVLLDQLISQLEKTITTENIAVEKEPAETPKNLSKSTPKVSFTAPQSGEPAKEKPHETPNAEGAGKKSGGKPGKAVAVATGSGNENEDNFAKSLMMVALIKEIEAHPQSDKLYLCKVEVNPREICQVVTGLQKFYEVEDLSNRKVVVIRNLKPAKLAGSLSEAMILAGSFPLPDGGEVVKVLDPPANAEIGDRIYLEGGAPSENPTKQLNSKSWEKIVSLFCVQDGKAVFSGKPLVCKAGDVSVPDLPNGAGIH